MTLIDAGPLIAITDAHDRYHSACSGALPHLTVPLITTYPALTEAMYFLGARIGWHAQQRLFRLLHSGLVRPEDLAADGLARMEELMAKYADYPMDFADASLVAIAEQRKLKRIFTIDEHFHVYRLHGREAFDVIPRQI